MKASVMLLLVLGLVAVGCTTKTVTREVTVVHTVLVPAATPAATVPAPAPAATSALLTAANLDDRCPGILAAPESESTVNIQECAWWYADLPSADPRRQVDKDRIRVEICKRGPAAVPMLINFGFTPSTHVCD